MRTPHRQRWTRTWSCALAWVWVLSWGAGCAPDAPTPERTDRAASERHEATDAPKDLQQVALLEDRVIELRRALSEVERLNPGVDNIACALECACARDADCGDGQACTGDVGSAACAPCEGPLLAYYPDCDWDGFADTTGPAYVSCSAPGLIPGTLCVATANAPVDPDDAAPCAPSADSAACRLPPECGDQTCDPDESPASCPADCALGTECDADGMCEADESAVSCPADCYTEGTCGDGLCDDGEDCPEDCPNRCEADADCPLGFGCNPPDGCEPCQGPPQRYHADCDWDNAGDPDVWVDSCIYQEYVGGCFSTDGGLPDCDDTNECCPIGHPITCDTSAWRWACFDGGCNSLEDDANCGAPGFACDPGTVCIEVISAAAYGCSAERCGDGICADEDLVRSVNSTPDQWDAGVFEDAESCPEDCAPRTECDADGVCEADESAVSCPADCYIEGTCGDGLCDSGEDCPEDCPDRCEADADCPLGFGCDPLDGCEPCQGPPQRYYADCDWDTTGDPNVWVDSCIPQEYIGDCFATDSDVPDCDDTNECCPIGHPMLCSQSISAWRWACFDGGCNSLEDDANCGAPGFACALGTACMEVVEAAAFGCGAAQCGDGICADIDLVGSPTEPDTSRWSSGAIEDPESCPEDCTPSTCDADGICEASESPVLCPADCYVERTCGDGLCDSGEDCPEDCPDRCEADADCPLGFGCSLIDGCVPCDGPTRRHYADCDFDTTPNLNIWVESCVTPETVNDCFTATSDTPDCDDDDPCCPIGQPIMCERGAQTHVCFEGDCRARVDMEYCYYEDVFCPSGTVCDNPNGPNTATCAAAECGDGICADATRVFDVEPVWPGGDYENILSCPEDCEATWICNADGVCDPDETPLTCAADCYVPGTCGDLVKDDFDECTDWDARCEGDVDCRPGTGCRDSNLTADIFERVAWGYCYPCEGPATTYSLDCNDDDQPDGAWTSCIDLTQYELRRELEGCVWLP